MSEQKVATRITSEGLDALYSTIGRNLATLTTAVMHLDVPYGEPVEIYRGRVTIARHLLRQVLAEMYTALPPWADAPLAQAAERGNQDG